MIELDFPRIERLYGRMALARGLNLVSLMDIFTILLFSLLAKSFDAKLMRQSADVSLPLSTAEKPNRETLLVEVSGDSVRVHANYRDVRLAVEHCPDTAGEGANG